MNPIMARKFPSKHPNKEMTAPLIANDVSMPLPACLIERPTAAPRSIARPLDIRVVQSAIAAQITEHKIATNTPAAIAFGKSCCCRSCSYISAGSFDLSSTASSTVSLLEVIATEESTSKTSQSLSNAAISPVWLQTIPLEASNFRFMHRLQNSRCSSRVMVATILNTTDLSHEGQSL